MLRQIVLDTETTGLNPHQGDRIVEIAALEMIGRRLTGKRYHTYLNPEREVPEEAARIHGLRFDFLSQQPTFAQACDAFCQFIEGGQLIIHNAPFDLSFLEAELSRVGAGPISRYLCDETIDTLVLARKKFSGRGHSLDALCRRFRIDNSARVLHGAELDTELLALVFLELTRGQEHLSFAEESVSNSDTDSSANRTNPASCWQLPSIPPSADEMAAHQQLLLKLDEASKGRCLWRQLSVPTDQSPPCA